ncbi:DNA breaking-rejoining protein [Escherichia coli]|nr:DNA breaking-rejoining protein [Escherichia coli]EHJ8738273.1 DNA breaking-rejoining protein [Escherichia coli]ELO2783028.1 DNA breaking-rejoining protein [Escherichia coli]ELX1519241.1 DNA breaking-rejoining protein [Escherichia coli]
MPNSFDRMAARMDAATIKKMGKTAIINGSSYDVVPAEQLEEMGPLSGTGTSLVVFSELYQPRRNDSVDYDGKNLIVTRYDMFNGKPHIHLE